MFEEHKTQKSERSGENLLMVSLPFIFMICMIVVSFKFIFSDLDTFIQSN